MTERRLKKPVLYGIYALGVIGLIGTFYLVYKNVATSQFKEKDPDYVNETIFDDTKPVVSDVKTLKRPYADTEIKVVKSYYDYKADADTQKKSIIYYENTYLQSSGVSYGGKDNFNVTSVLAGTVIEVKKDDVLGNIVQIRHENEVISAYQSLSEVTVKKGDTVTQGQIIGKSGTNSMSSDLGNHLYFELVVNGQAVDPELYYDKALPTTSTNENNTDNKKTTTDDKKTSEDNKTTDNTDSDKNTDNKNTTNNEKAD